MDGGVDRGAWWAAVHGVAKSRTWLNDFFHFSLSRIGEGNGNPLQCSCLENPRDRGAWWADIYGVSQSRTWLKWLSSSIKLGEQRLQYTRQIIYLDFTELVQKVVKQTTVSCKNNLGRGTNLISRVATLFLFSSGSVMSDSLQPHRLQHARLPYPSLSPRGCSNSWPLNQWCHPTTSSSVIPFSSCLQSFPVSGSFSMSQLFSSGQSIGASTSASVLAMNIQDWFPEYSLEGLTGFIFLLSKRLSSLFQHHSFKWWILWHSPFSLVHLWHLYMTTGKTIASTVWTFVSKVLFLLFNMLSRFVIAFLLKDKRLLILWLQSPSTVILEPKKTKSVSVSILSPFYLPWRDGTGCHDLSFLNVEF